MKYQKKLEKVTTKPDRVLTEETRLKIKRIIRKGKQPIVEIPKSKAIEHRNQFFMDEYAIEKKKLFKFKTGRGE